MVDAIGVVISADNPKSFLLKDGRNVEKRILQIVDESESKIEVVWLFYLRVCLFALCRLYGEGWETQ